MKRSHWKRLAATAAALLLLLCLLAGCNQSEGGGEKQEAKALEGEEVVDTEGYTFVVYDYFLNHWAPEAGKGVEVDDEVTRIMDEVQDLYHCTIEARELNVNEVFNQLQPAVAAGDKFGDLIIATMWAYGPLLGAGGLLGDLKTVPGLHLEADWWNQNVLETCTINGKTLAGACTFTDHSYLTWSCYFNKDMFRALGHDPEEIYNLVRQGKWTYDKFLAYAKEALQDKDSSGVVDSAEDIWGLVAPGGDYNRAAFLAMGGHFYDHDDKGKLKLACTDQHSLDVVEFMRKMFREDKIWMDSESEPFNEIMQHFIDEHSLFIMCSPGEEQLRTMEGDFGFVPQPKWNEEQKDYIGMVDHNAPLMCITSTNRDLNKAGPIMDAVARRYEAICQLRLDNWNDTIWRSPEDDEMMRTYVYRHGGYDLAPIAQNAVSSLRVPMDAVVQHTMGSRTDFAAYMEAREDMLNDLLDQYAEGELTN